MGIKEGQRHQCGPHRHQQSLIRSHFRVYIASCKTRPNPALPRDPLIATMLMSNIVHYGNTTAMLCCIVFCVSLSCYCCFVLYCGDGNDRMSSVFFKVKLHSNDMQYFLCSPLGLAQSLAVKAASQGVLLSASCLASYTPN